MIIFSVITRVVVVQDSPTLVVHQNQQVASSAEYYY